jgi:hypothetical protein
LTEIMHNNLFKKMSKCSNWNDTHFSDDCLVHRFHKIYGSDYTVHGGGSWEFKDCV